MDMSHTEVLFEAQSQVQKSYFPALHYYTGEAWATTERASLDGSLPERSPFCLEVLELPTGLHGHIPITTIYVGSGDLKSTPPHS